MFDWASKKINLKFDLEKVVEVVERIILIDVMLGAWEDKDWIFGTALSSRRELSSTYIFHNTAL